MFISGKKVKCVNTGEHRASPQHVVYVLHHDALHVPELRAELRRGPAPRARATLAVLLARALHPRIELDECVRTSHCVYLKL